MRRSKRTFTGARLGHGANAAAQPAAAGTARKGEGSALRGSPASSWRSGRLRWVKGCCSCGAIDRTSYRAAAAPGKTGIDDQSKAFRMASGEHLNRARRESSWLGGKGRFFGRRRLQGRRATDRPRCGRWKLPGRTASRKRCALERVRPGDRERQISWRN